YKQRLEDFGLIAEIGHENPITSKIESKTLPIPGRAGLWDFGSEIKEKEISIPVACVGHDRINLQQKLNDFVAFLFDEFGKPREIKVVFDYEKEKFYTVKLAEQLNPERIIHLGRFVLSLVAYDPYKYASANQYDKTYRYDQDYLYDIGLMYDNPKSFKWQYERHYSGINNYSSLVTDFVIEIQGTVQNGSIKNLENNQKLTLPDISNGKLAIDGKHFSIIRN